MLFEKQTLGCVAVAVLISSAVSSGLRGDKPTYSEIVAPALKHELEQIPFCSHFRNANSLQRIAPSLVVILAPESWDAALAINDLGLDNYEAQNYEEAARLFKLALRLNAVHKWPVLHAAVMSNLAKTYHHMGLLTEAERLYQQSIELRQRCFNPNSCVLIRPMVNLACLLLEQQRYAEAKEWLNKAVLLTREIDHWDEEPNTNQCKKQHIFIETELQKLVETPYGRSAKTDIQNKIKQLKNARLDDRRIEFPL